MLTGLFDASGERLTPTHAVKKGTRYRYYVSTALITGARKPNTGGWRIPAGNLEGLVIDRLRKLFAEQGELLDTVGEQASSGIGTKQLIERAGRIAEDLSNGSPGDVRPLVISLLRRVAIRPDAVAIEVDRQRLASVLQSDGDEPQHRNRDGQHQSWRCGRHPSRTHRTPDDCATNRQLEDKYLCKINDLCGGWN